MMVTDGGHWGPLSVGYLKLFLELPPFHCNLALKVLSLCLLKNRYRVGNIGKILSEATKVAKDEIISIRVEEG